MNRLLARGILCAALFASLVPAASPVHAGQAGAPQGDAVGDLVAQVLQSGDTEGLPFIIVDKQGARVLAFDATGLEIGATPALLGLERGDVSSPGVGSMRLADIGPALRITPAGRYAAHLGVNLAGRTILWIDYDDALSLHSVVTANAAEHRLQRLATPSILDNRISYGCINVPALFYEEIVRPLFGPANGVVYILPEAPASTVHLLASI